MRIFRVQIDMPCLREHLSSEEKRSLSDSEIERWLTDAGFTRTGSGWLVKEPDLGHLEPTEVLTAEVVQENEP